MNTEFVALPVGQGDAFYLRREGLRILVDGGKSIAQAAKLLENRLRKPHLDIVVCTHADSDHANGVLGLLESETFSVGEVWLPGRWTQRLTDLLRPSWPLIDELVKDVTEAGFSTLEADETTARDVQKDNDDKARDVTPSTTPNMPGHEEDVPVEEDGLLEAISHPGGDPWSQDHWWWRRVYDDPVKSSLFNECLTTAQVIRRIAVAAHKIGARIRWFDFDQFQADGTVPSGGVAQLRPVNAVEISRRFARKKMSLLRYLSLSVANRESLVFESPSTADAPGVLFTADSDLAFPLSNHVKANYLVTAPHHGSDSNAAAYRYLQGVVPLPTLRWVRSDGRFSSRPGASFLGVKAHAMCTRCRQSTSAGQVVALRPYAGAWIPEPGVNACHCT